MTNHRSILIPAVVLVLALVSAISGFVLGRSQESIIVVPPVPTIAPASSTTMYAADFIAESVAPVDLPEASFTDVAGMEAYVGELQTLGVSEDLAQWIALTNAVRDDLPGSLALAKEARLERYWAVAVALHHPEDGLDLVRSIRGATHMTISGFDGPLTEFFRTLGQSNAVVGYELLSGLSGLDRQSGTYAFFGSWFEVDSHAARNAALRIDSPGQRESALRGIFAEWGERGAQDMMAWAGAQNGKLGKLAFESQLANLRKSPETVLELARKFPDSVSSVAVINAAGSLSGRGAEAWQEIVDFPKGILRDGMISTFANRFSEANPQAAWEFAKSLPPEDQRTFLGRSNARTLASVGGAELADIVNREDSSIDLDVEEVVTHWASADPRDAFDWSVNNLSGKNRVDGLGNALRVWAKADPATAVRALDGLQPAMRAKLLPDLASSWAESDPQAALNFTKSLPEIDRVRATEGALRGWAYADPTAAAAALAELPPAGLQGAYDTISYRLTDKNPTAAAQWAVAIPDERMRNRVVRRVTEGWGEKDASAVSDFLTELEPGTFRDQAVVGFVESVRELDPPTAAAWAKSVGDADLQQTSLRNTLSAWKTKDPAAARRFAESLEPGPLRDEMFKVTAP